MHFWFRVLWLCNFGPLVSIATIGSLGYQDCTILVPQAPIVLIGSPRYHNSIILVPKHHDCAIFEASNLRGIACAFWNNYRTKLVLQTDSNCFACDLKGNIQLHTSFCSKLSTLFILCYTIDRNDDAVFIKINDDQPKSNFVDVVGFKWLFMNWWFWFWLWLYKQLFHIWLVSGGLFEPRFQGMQVMKMILETSIFSKTEKIKCK